MKLQRIELSNFRNFAKQEFLFDESVTFIMGENARGKTNILEAIYFITMGLGFRDSKEEELMTILSNNTYVKGDFVSNVPAHFQIFLAKDSTGKLTKTYTVSKTKKQHNQYLALSTRAVLFSPDQILIMIGSPDIRRSYIDRVIFSFDGEYRKRLFNYESALRKRNKVLEFHSGSANLKEELSFWDVYLTEQATYISGARKKYVDFLNANSHVENKEFRVEYLENPMTIDRLEESFNKERIYRRTLIGPQKDDYVIFQKEKISDKNLHHFGSRSEQRLAVFWLKLNEAKVYEEKNSLKPILLLDDIFSELDGHNKRLTLETIHDYQTVMTTTEPETVDLVKKSKKVISL